MELLERIDIERQVVRRMLEVGIERGYTIGVHDGQEVVIRGSQDIEAILAVMFSVDDERVFFDYEGGRLGSVRLIYGNSGWDVIADNSMGVEDMLQPVFALADELENAYWDKNPPVVPWRV